MSTKHYYLQKNSEIADLQHKNEHKSLLYIFIECTVHVTAIEQSSWTAASFEKLRAGEGTEILSSFLSLKCVGFGFCILKPVNVSSPATFHHGDFVVI